MSTHVVLSGRCSLTPNFIELQLVPLGHPKRFTVHLANEGSCAARYYFVPPPKPRMSNDGLMSWDDNQPISPPWLQISPAEGEVAPGGWHEGGAAGSYSLLFSHCTKNICAQAM